MPQLDISQEEVNVLAAILMHIGGHPDGPRKHLDSLMTKLSPTEPGCQVKSGLHPSEPDDKFHAMYIFPLEGAISGKEKVQE